MLNRSWQGAWEFAALQPLVGKTERHSANFLSRILAASLVLSIDAYRRLVSPLLGPHCRFHPTCSRYAVEAIQRYGPLRGTACAIARLTRCHPLTDGGYDPVR